MAIALPKLRIGEPIRHEALAVFPLFASPNGTLDYALSEEALADKTVTVEELSEAGSVPELIVDNKSGRRVLFLEGEELIGAKQNRILNTSVLVAAGSKVRIPVSCVEQGRWRYKSKQFAMSGSQAPAKLRHLLKGSVTASVQASRGHSSDQMGVWEEVQKMQAQYKVASPTGAMSDAYDGYKESIDAFRQRLPYAEGATGLAVAIHDRIVAVDVFDKPATCQKVWNRLLSGYYFDAAQAGTTDKKAQSEDVAKLLQNVEGLPWQEGPAVGEGEEFRAESNRGDQASVLACEGVVVHESVLAGA